MGLVTEDFTSLLSSTTEQTKEAIADNPFRTRLFVSASASDDSGWHHAVHRFRKWLRTTLAAHGGHGDGLTH